MDGNKTKAKRQAVKELRKVKLVIGNGFDLQCGLHSSYADYFKRVQHLMDALCEWDRLFTSVEKYLHDTTANNFWRQLQHFDEINTWDCFFYYRANNRIESINWCDIEKEMLNSFTSTKYPNFWDEVYSWGQQRYYSAKKDDRCKLMLAALIRRKRKEIWFENEQEFYFFLLDELKKFELRFGDFIKEQQTEEYKKNYENLVVSLCNYSNLTSIDSFNYSVFEQEGYRQINVNGNYSMPIFGIDSQRVTTNAPYYIFSKTYRRIENDTENKRFDVDPEFENVIVYGHSLCENDYSYFFPIMDKLKLYDFTAEGQIVFAYRVYDKERESEIKTKYRLAIASLIEAYAVYRGIPQPNRLLDSLSIFNRVWLYELETIVKVMPIGRTTISAEIKIETK